MKRLELLHPLAFASYPILYVFAQNLAVVPTTDLMWLLLGSWAAVGVALFAAKKWASRPERVAAILSALMVFFCAYPSFRALTGRLAVLELTYFNESIFIRYWLATALVIGVGIWLLSAYAATARFFGFFAAGLLFMAAFSVVTAFGRYRSFEEIRGKSIPAKRGSNGSTKPDIFYIVLDGYARDDVLRRVFNISNVDFLNRLRKLGFYVADKSHSNYVQTQLSLPSSLNLGFIQDLLPQEAPDSGDRRALDGMLDHNLVSDLLRKEGYAYIGVGSGFPFLKFAAADHSFVSEEDFPKLSSLVLNLTPFGASREIAHPAFERKRLSLLRAFALARQMAGPSVKPRFFVVHVMAPHPSFVFNPDGSLRPSKVPFGLWDGSHFFEIGGTMKEYLDGYRDQLTYINTLVLELVAHIDRVNPGAIVILQGDHGSKSHLDQRSLERTDLKEVFSILNCYKVPPQIRARLYPSITPVNSFRTLLSELFGYDLPQLSDKSYFSTFETPFQFVDVTDAVKD